MVKTNKKLDNELWVGRDNNFGSVKECDYRVFTDEPTYDKKQGCWTVKDDRLYLERNCPSLWQKFIGFTMRPGEMGKMTISYLGDGSIRVQLKKIDKKKGDDDEAEIDEPVLAPD